MTDHASLFPPLVKRSLLPEKTALSLGLSGSPGAWPACRFEKFIEVFNHELRHEALDMKCTAEVYQPSRVAGVAAFASSTDV